MVETVAGVYNSLPPEERAKTAILAHNYGGAGAIDFFGPRYGLLKSISPHQSYYYWGPRQYTGESLILLWISKMPALMRQCGSGANRRSVLRHRVGALCHPDLP